MKWLWLVLGALVIVAGLAWFVSDVGNKRQIQKDQRQSTDTSTSVQTATTVEWAFTGSAWKALGSAPSCPEPLTLMSPVNTASATAILYPGQTRGGNYKPHGGFRFADDTNATIAVTAPLDASLVRGSRYIEQGEIQYLLEFVNSCGIAYRFDHLLTLAQAIQSVVEEFPEPQVDDSRTSNVNQSVVVKQGDTIGTAVGITATGNTFVDFGVYDLRTKNGASGLPADDNQLAPYAVCWLDLLPAADQAIVRALPAGDEQSGATSSYCK